MCRQEDGHAKGQAIDGIRLTPRWLIVTGMIDQNHREPRVNGCQWRQQRRPPNEEELGVLMSERTFAHCRRLPGTTAYPSAYSTSRVRHQYQ